MNLFRRRQPAMAHRVRHPLMQPDPDMTLPYWVATDHAIWGTFKDIYGATNLFHEVVASEAMGERVFLLADGKRVNEKRGAHPRRRYSFTR